MIRAWRKGRIKEAQFYENIEGTVVQCHLCPHHCKIMDGKRGICGVRENNNGILHSLVYGKLVSRAVDPIEKKPLFHFLPGSYAYSIATVGCNLRCKNCQNWEISQSPKPQRPIMGAPVPPHEVVEATQRLGCRSIAYTYTEPTIFLEYALDTAKLAIKKGIKNVFVTNGYIAEEPLKKTASLIHAANIDLKSFSERFYKENCGAHLEPLLNAIRLYHELGVWIEITTLVIPGLNDSKKNFRAITNFIVEIDAGIPWHISSFFPAYQLIDYPPTPIESLHTAREIGVKAGLRYIYLGNVFGEGENTYCHKCDKLLIERYGYRIVQNRITDSKCPYCGSEIDGEWVIKSTK